MSGAKPPLQKLGQLALPLDTRTRKRRVRKIKRRKQIGGCRQRGRGVSLASKDTGGIIYAKGSLRDRYGAILYDPRT